MHVRDQYELRRLDEKLRDLLCQVATVRRTVAATTDQEATSERVFDARFSSLTEFVADAVGDVNARLGKFNQILIELQEQPA